jgi:signal transduction histidine kinase
VQTPRGEPTAREAPTTAGSAVLAGAPSALSLARLVEELASTGARPSEAARLLSWAAEALHSVAPDVAPRAEAPALPRVEGPGAPADLRIFDEALRTVGDLLEALESERQVRRRAQLSYLVHELKNPLNTIVNALWLLRERGAITDPNRRFLELAERGAERLEVRLQGLRQLE